MINSEPLPGRWKKTLGCQGTYFMSVLDELWMSYISKTKAQFSFNHPALSPQKNLP